MICPSAISSPLARSTKVWFVVFFDYFHLFEADIMNLVHQSCIHVNVHDVRVDMQDVRVDVQDVSNMVQGVDDKLDQANRSLSLDPDSHSARSCTCASLQQYARMLTVDSQSSLTRRLVPQRVQHIPRIKPIPYAHQQRTARTTQKQDVCHKSRPTRRPCPLHPGAHSRHSPELEP